MGKKSGLYNSILVVCNLFAAILMFVRMIIMLFLTIIGPIFATLHAVNKEDKIHITYKDWAEWYIGLSIVQVVFAIVCKIMLEIAL